MKITYNGQECDVPQWAIETAYNNGYAAGVKDLAERMKQTFHSDSLGDSLIRNIIDLVSKEMVGADNG